MHHGIFERRVPITPFAPRVLFDNREKLAEVSLRGGGEGCGEGGGREDRGIDGGMVVRVTKEITTKQPNTVQKTTVCVQVEYISLFLQCYICDFIIHEM